MLAEDCLRAGLLSALPFVPLSPFSLSELPLPLVPCNLLGTPLGCTLGVPLRVEATEGGRFTAAADPGRREIVEGLLVGFCGVGVRPVAGGVGTGGIVLVYVAQRYWPSHTNNICGREVERGAWGPNGVLMAALSVLGAMLIDGQSSKCEAEHARLPALEVTRIHLATTGDALRAGGGRGEGGYETSHRTRNRLSVMHMLSREVARNMGDAGSGAPVGGRAGRCRVMNPSRYTESQTSAFPPSHGFSSRSILILCRRPSSRSDKVILRRALTLLTSPCTRAIGLGADSSCQSGNNTVTSKSPSARQRHAP